MRVSHLQTRRDGFALVTSLLVVIILSLLAVAAVVLSTTEKRTTFADSVHDTAVFAADAGGEAAINFLRLCDRPPRYVDDVTRLVRTISDEPLIDTQEYDYACFVNGWGNPAGWDQNYISLVYRVASNGRASIQGNSDVQLVASRLFRKGYN